MTWFGWSQIAISIGSSAALAHAIAVAALSSASTKHRKADLLTIVPPTLRRRSCLLCNLPAYRMDKINIRSVSLSLISIDSWLEYNG
jgi:hypothetical protein